LENHDVMLWAVSQAPFAKLQTYKQRMGWQFPWASASGGTFNADFNASYTEEQQVAGIEYNYRRENPRPLSTKGVNRDPGIATRTTPDAPANFGAMSGVDMDTYLLQRPGLSAFVLDDGVVYHTYSSYARGLDGLWGMYQWLDRAPKGRNENGVWWRRHDEYAAR